MDKEQLEDYEEREISEVAGYWKKIEEGKFSFKRDRYPPARRFMHLQEPIAYASSPELFKPDNFCSLIPFSGSLILPLAPVSKPMFEQIYFEVSKIPEIIEFIKDTGRLQLVLSGYPLSFVGLDHFDSFFKELKPPVIASPPSSYFGDKKEIQRAVDTFFTLARVGVLNRLKTMSELLGSQTYSVSLNKSVGAYVFLKVRDYKIVEDIENLMIDDPDEAIFQLTLSRALIIEPASIPLAGLHNFTLGTLKEAQTLHLTRQIQDLRFPYEVGKFLLKKLTFAPRGLDACKELMYHYEAYDLRKVQKSLNEAIVTNQPNIVSKKTADLSEVLDNVWNDKTIPKRIENIKIGVPISIAAIGAVAGGLVGGTAGVGAGGFLAELGFKVGQKAVEKFFSAKAEELSERLVKLRTKNYQANVYDFKKKYKGRIRA